MSEAANLVFQWTFSVKHKFFRVIIIKNQPAIYDRAFLQKTSWGNADKYFYKQAPSSM